MVLLPRASHTRGGAGLVVQAVSSYPGPPGAGWALLSGVHPAGPEQAVCKEQVTQEAEVQKVGDWAEGALQTQEGKVLSQGLSEPSLVRSSWAGTCCRGRGRSDRRGRAPGSWCLSTPHSPTLPEQTVAGSLSSRAPGAVFPPAHRSYYSASMPAHSKARSCGCGANVS